MATSTNNSSNYDPGNGFQPGDPSYRPTNPLNPSQAGGTVLNTSSLAPATTNIPYVAPTPVTSTTMPAVEAAGNSVDAYIKAMTPATQQPTESIGDTLSRQIAELTGQTVNQKSDTFAQEESLGMSQKIQDLQVAQDRVKNLQAAYQKGYANLWNRDKGMTLLSGEQLALKSQAEADIAFAQAEVSAKQGDITTAQTLAKRAVDQKYAPILAQIETKKAQLEALQPLLSKEEKIRSAAQTAALNKLQKEEEAKAQEEKDWKALKIDASSGGIPTATLDKADQAFKAGNKNQAYALLGPYGKAYLERKKINAEINKLKADATKASNTGAGKLGSVGISKEAQGYIDLIDKKAMTLTEVLNQIPKNEASRALRSQIVQGALMSGGATEMTKETIIQARDLAKELNDTKAWRMAGLAGGVTGNFSITQPVDYADATYRLNQLNDILALDSLGLLKGAMSDADREFIKNVKNGASFAISEDLAKKRIESIYQKLDAKVKDYGFEPKDGEQSKQENQSKQQTQSVWDKGDTQAQINSTPLVNMAQKGMIKSAEPGKDIQFNLPE